MSRDSWGGGADLGSQTPTLAHRVAEVERTGALDHDGLLERRLGNVGHVLLVALGTVGIVVLATDTEAW